MPAYPHLTALEAAGLVRVAQFQPELEYLFRHALIQDAAYASLLKADRKQLHRAVGEALEKLFPDAEQETPELVPLLGEHFARADEVERAAQYFTRAGDAAAQRYANREAIQHYTRALDLLRPQLPTLPATTVRYLYMQIGRMFELLNEHAEAFQYYVALEQLAQARADEKLELDTIIAQARLRCTPTSMFSPPEGHQLADRALALAERTHNPIAQSQIYWTLMQLGTFTGQLEAAFQAGEQAITVAREHQLAEQLAFALNDITFIYMGRGDFQRSLEALEEARRYWLTSNNRPMLADGWGRATLVHYMLGDEAASLVAAQAAHDISLAINNQWGIAFSQVLVGSVYFDLGFVEKGLRLAHEALTIAEQAQMMPTLVNTTAELGWRYGQLGDVAQGLSLTERALTYARHMPQFNAWPLGLQARLLIRQGDLDAAQAAIQAGQIALQHSGLISYAGPLLIPLAEAELALARHDAPHAHSLLDNLLKFLRAYKMHAYYLDILQCHAQTWVALNQPTAAQTVLAEARAEAEAKQLLFPLWQILSAQSALAPNAEAQSLRAQAWQIIQRIADQTPPEWRATFLQTPRVRELEAG